MMQAFEMHSSLDNRHAHKMRTTCAQNAHKMRTTGQVQRPKDFGVRLCAVFVMGAGLLGHAQMLVWSDEIDLVGPY